MKNESDNQTKTDKEEAAKAKNAPSPKSPKSKSKRSQSLIKKLKLKSKSKSAEGKSPDIDANLIQNRNEERSCALTKSRSDVNLLQDKWDIEDLPRAGNPEEQRRFSMKSALDVDLACNPLRRAESSERTGLPERTKSLDNIKNMPAYGELILEQTTPSTSTANQTITKPKDHLYKILVIGDAGTGKTSIIKRYVHGFFTQNYRSTIGVDFALKVLNWDKNTLIRLQLWDIAGQEYYGNMTRVYYKEAVGAIIVFDVTRKNTFQSVANWKSDLDSKVQLPDGSPIPCVLLANKCDQKKEGMVNNPEQMDNYCQEHGFTAWFETSAMHNINIEEATKALVGKILDYDTLINNERKSSENQFALKNDSNSANGRKSCSC